MAVYDPAGTLNPVLSDANIEAAPLSGTDPKAALRRVSLAIVGEDALTAQPDAVSTLQGLLDYVREGGTLLVLAQHTLPWDLPVSLISQEASLAFVRDPADPVLQGLDDRDFSHWLPNGLLSDTLLAKTTWGGFRPLLDCGGPEGLNAAALAEVRFDKGRLLLCQLPLVRRYGVDPDPTRLLRNLLAHATADLASAQPLAVLAAPETSAWLTAVGADTVPAVNASGRLSLNSGQTLLVGDFAAVRGHESELQDFVRRGGTVVLHNVTPDNVETVTRLLGGPLTLQTNTNAGFAVVDATGPARALSNEDLAWFAPSEEGTSLSSSVAGFLADASGLTGAKAYVEPHVLLSVPHGRGQWVVDQVQWDGAGAPEVAADRYLATLLQNLGVSFSPPSAKAPPPPAPIVIPPTPASPVESGPPVSPAPVVAPPAPPPSVDSAPPAPPAPIVIAPPAPAPATPAPPAQPETPVPAPATPSTSAPTAPPAAQPAPPRPPNRPYRRCRLRQGERPPAHALTTPRHFAYNRASSVPHYRFRRRGRNWSFRDRTRGQPLPGGRRLPDRA